ncbi:glycosyltransferase family 17 protein, partial [Tilletiaria anomala UBC 951]
MGQPKNLSFQESFHLFEAFESEISPSVHHGREMTPQDGSFTLVIEMRQATKPLFSEHRSSLQIPSGSLVFMSGADEIPSRGTMSLLKARNSPLLLHLQMRTYLYSY